MGQQIKSVLLESVHRVLVMLAAFLPGVVALVLALAIFALLGIGFAALLRRLLTAVRFDERVALRESRDVTTSVADWSPSHSPSLLMARAILWLCVLLGIIVGVMAFDASYGQSASIAAFVLPYLTHLTGAVLLLLTGGFLARFLERSVLIGAVNARLQYARLLSLGVKWLVLVLTAAMVLDHLQISRSIVDLAFGILFGGIVLTLALAIGIGSYPLVSRLIEKQIEKDSDPLTAEPGPGRNDPVDVRHF